MDEQQLQQKERDLKVLESNLSVREANLNLQETRDQMGINRQEFLRRAIEVGTNALQKLDAMVEKEKDVMRHFIELIDTAAVKLKKELSK